MDVRVGSAASVRVEFASPAGMQVPDPGSVTFSLFDHGGTALQSDVAVAVDPDQTSATIPLASGSQTIAAGRRFEKRILITTWQLRGETFSATQAYRVIPLPLYVASPDTVRTFLGYTADELPDAAIDLFEAYLKLADQLGGTLLDEALVSGTLAEPLANEGLTLTAAIKLIPSLRLRTLMSTDIGQDRVSRFRDTPKFEILEQQARDRLAAIVGDLSPNLTAIVPTFLVLATVVDTITGV